MIIEHQGDNADPNLSMFSGSLSDMPARDVILLPVNLFLLSQ